MKRRVVGVILCVIVLGGAAWLAGRGGADGKVTAAWSEVVPGVLRSPGLPAGYALIDGDRALLVDAPSPVDGLRTKGVRKVEIGGKTKIGNGFCAALGREMFGEAL